MSSELKPQELDPRAPIQAGDEGGSVEETSGSDHGNDPTPDEQPPPPPVP
jgi:hypothetical protein